MKDHGSSAATRIRRRAHTATAKAASASTETNIVQADSIRFGHDDGRPGIDTRSPVLPGGIVGLTFAPFTGQFTRGVETANPIVDVSITIVVATVADLSNGRTGDTHGNLTDDTPVNHPLTGAHATDQIGNVLVENAIAVVVENVADLLSHRLSDVGLAGRRCTVATRRRRDRTGPESTVLGRQLVDFAIAIIVDGVADFLIGRTRRTRPGNTVDTSRHLNTAGADAAGLNPTEAFVKSAVAIIIEVVATLGVCSGRLTRDRGSIDAGRDHAVALPHPTIDGGQAFVVNAVTIVVEAIAALVIGFDGVLTRAPDKAVADFDAGLTSAGISATASGRARLGKATVCRLAIRTYALDRPKGSSGEPGHGCAAQICRFTATGLFIGTGPNGISIFGTRRQFGTDRRFIVITEIAILLTTSVVTAIATGPIAVVAFLGSGKNTITTDRRTRGWNTVTGVTGLDLALIAASIAHRAVTVVAGLIECPDAIAAYRRTFSARTLDPGVSGREGANPNDARLAR
jgi:hypothetical protein